MKKKQIGLLFIFCLTLNLNNLSYAQDKEVEYKNMEQMVKAIHLEKKQVENMLDKLIISGRISAEEGSQAKREIASIKESDLNDLKEKAFEEIKNKKLLSP